MHEDDLHWLDEGISRSEEDRGVRDDGDEGPSQRGNILRWIHPLLVVMMKMVVMMMKLVVMNLMIAIMGETPVLREKPMMLVEANKVVLICHGIQISMPHKILIMEAD